MQGQLSPGGKCEACVQDHATRDKRCWRTAARQLNGANTFTSDTGYGFKCKGLCRLENTPARGFCPRARRGWDAIGDARRKPRCMRRVKVRGRPRFRGSPCPGRLPYRGSATWLQQPRRGGASPPSRRGLLKEKAKFSRGAPARPMCLPPQRRAVALTHQSGRARATRDAASRAARRPS